MDNPARFRPVNPAANPVDQDARGFTFRPDLSAVPSARQPEPIDVDAPRTSMAGPPAYPDTQSYHDTIVISGLPQKRSAPESPSDVKVVISPGLRAESPSRLARESVERSRAYPRPTSWAQPEERNKRPWVSESADEAQMAEALQRELSSTSHADSDEMNVDDDRADSPRSISSPHRESSSTNATPRQGRHEGREPSKRRFTTRTKTGCHTCRKRKKKCDETKPVCNNCTKGGFTCTGYGERRIVSPPLMAGPSHTRVIYGSDQAREHFNAPFRNGPPSWTEQRPTHQPSKITETRAPHEAVKRDVWTTRDRAHSTGRSSVPLQSGPPQTATGHAPPPPQPHHTHHSPSLQQWPPQPPPPPLPQQVQGSGHMAARSAPTSGPPQAYPNGPPADSRYFQRQKMVSGRPYRHYMDAVLQEDRRQCRLALENWHDALKPSRTTAEEECARLFKAIILPEGRRHTSPDGKPTGFIGRRVIVEAPFTCEYGYNISLGDGVTIQSGCFIQDPCQVTIGANTNIGPNVKIYGMTMATDARARGGFGSLGIGSPVTIEEHCYIGASVVITPGVTIKSGSVIDAGTVVTKDVPANVQFGGSPPQVLRGISVSMNASGGHDPRRHEDDDPKALLML